MAQRGPVRVDFSRRCIVFEQPAPGLAVWCIMLGVVVMKKVMAPAYSVACSL